MDKICIGENEIMPVANIGFAKWRVKYFYDSLVQGSSSVFQLNICAKNPPLRKAEKRYMLCYGMTNPEIG